MCTLMHLTPSPLDFVLLGFLLGAFGGHLFYVKNTKRALIFLLLGLVGSGIPILIFYTTAISFADAFIACFYKKIEAYDLKKELLTLVYEMRYYNCIYLGGKQVRQFKLLKNELFFIVLKSKHL